MAQKKKKKTRTNATYKAFFVVIIALFIIWIAIYINGNFKIVKKDGDKKVNFLEAFIQKNSGENTLSEIETYQPATLKESTEENSLIATKALTSQSESVTLSTEESTTQNTTSTLGEVYDYSNKTISWSFKRNNSHSPVLGYNEGVDLASFDAHYIADTSEKVIYLTFDEGYENGYTSKILDTLAKNNVNAAFFVTKAYVDSSPELIKRMKAEGHIVGNHSATHPDMTTKTDEEFIEELDSTRLAMQEASGYEMDMFFRPPQGKFSERTLYKTYELGYSTIFWSMAYQDWLVDAQPGKEYAYNHVIENIHPGAIILLHAVSSSNADALEDIIRGLKSEGYTFSTLYDLKR